jgi:hypothetical protein
MDWQPIETAPKDGRWMLAAWHIPKDDFGYCVSVVRYAGNSDWREKLGDGADDPVCLPTHWMPLPAPPEAA